MAQNGSSKAFVLKLFEVVDLSNDESIIKVCLKVGLISGLMYLLSDYAEMREAFYC